MQANVTIYKNNYFGYYITAFKTFTKMIRLELTSLISVDIENVGQGHIS